MVSVSKWTCFFSGSNGGRVKEKLQDARRRRSSPNCFTVVLPEKSGRIDEKVTGVNWKFVADFEDATHGSEAHDFLVWMIIVKTLSGYKHIIGGSSQHHEKNHNFQLLDVCCGNPLLIFKTWGD